MEKYSLKNQMLIFFALKFFQGAVIRKNITIKLKFLLIYELYCIYLRLFFNHEKTRAYRKTNL